MSQPAGKILVIRGGAIGDFILTLPVLAALRSQFPKARLEMLGYARTGPLAQAGGALDGFRSIESRPLAGFFARNGELAPELQEYFASFAIIVSYLYDPDEIFQTNVACCSKAQFIVGPHRPNEREGRHATEVFLKPLERLAIFDADPVPRLDVAQASPQSPPLPVEQASSLSPPSIVGQASSLSLPPPAPCLPRQDTSPFLALHPGSGGEHKNWPEEKWAELIERIARERQWKILLVGGEAEGDRLERIASRGGAGRVELARNLPLLELARRLSSAQAFVGHDSGITHLAAALGLPGLALWGPTMESVWRPRSARMKLLRDPAGLGQLPVETVAAELFASVADDHVPVNPSSPGSL